MTRRRISDRRALLLVVTLVAAAGCRGGAGGGPAGKKAVEPRPLPPCPAEAPAPPVLPFSSPEHLVVDFWLARAQQASARLMTAAQIAAHNQRVSGQRRDGWPAGRWDLLSRPRDPRRLAARLALQLERLREATAAGKRVLRDGSKPTALIEQLGRRLRAAAPADELRVAWRGTPIRCYPTDEAIYDEPWQLAFDLMQCSQLRYGEPVRVLRKGRRFWYVWASYTEGWVAPGALTPPLSAEAAAGYLRPARALIVDRDRLPLYFGAAGSGDLAVARLGVRLPLVGDEAWRVRAPRRGGLAEARLPARYQPRAGPRPLSREALWRVAFSLLNAPYGWGGTGGHRDCSRMLMDLFALFGLELPRNSWHQGQSGARTVEVAELDEGAKVAAIERAGAAGVVLLYLPGHIMLYLGRDGDHLYALHQFSGYLSLCEGRRGSAAAARETMNRVNRATVTSLELGRGSSRRAFIERITRLVVFDGSGAGPTSAPVGAPPRD